MFRHIGMTITLWTMALMLTWTKLTVVNESTTKLNTSHNKTQNLTTYHLSQQNLRRIIKKQTSFLSVAKNKIKDNNRLTVTTKIKLLRSKANDKCFLFGNRRTALRSFEVVVFYE